MKYILIVLFLGFALSGCTKSDHSTQILTSMGYKNIIITGYRIFGCPSEDKFHTGFSAISQTGQSVSGVVCSGWIYGSVVRID